MLTSLLSSFLSFASFDVILRHSSSYLIDLVFHLKTFLLLNSLKTFDTKYLFLTKNKTFIFSRQPYLQVVALGNIIQGQMKTFLTWLQLCKFCLDFSCLYLIYLNFKFPQKMFKFKNFNMNIEYQVSLCQQKTSKLNRYVKR